MSPSGYRATEPVPGPAAGDALNPTARLGDPQTYSRSFPAGTETLDTDDGPPDDGRPVQYR